MLTDGTNSLDQSVPNNSSYFVKLAERVIDTCLQEKSFDFAFASLEGFRSVNKDSSLAVCRILHGVNSHWDEFEHEETFIQEAIRKTGYSRLTIERYISVWELLTGEYIPSEFRDCVQNQTMRQLVKEASLVIDQGYELEHDDWRDLSEAIDEHRVAEVSARIKGKPRNKNHMSLKIGDDGWVVAHQEDKEENVGQLFIDSESPLVQKAVKRILDSAGISKRSEY